MYAYDETLLWKNKYDALKKEHEELQKILKDVIPDTMKLAEIIRIVHLKDFSENFKLELIKNILKQEVAI